MRFLVASLIALAGCSSSSPAPGSPQWISQTSQTEWLRGVWGSSANDVYAVGGSGTILHSTNHGKTWTGQPTGSQALLLAIGGSGPGDVHVAGTGGTVLHSGNGGATWVENKSPTYLPIHGVFASAPGKVFIAAGDDLGGSQVLLTTGAGETWSVQAALGEIATPRPAAPEPAELMGIWGSGADLIAVGEDELASGGSLVMRSSDGGKTWSKRTGDVSQHLMAVWGSASSDVYAVGYDGTIIHTANRGDTWTRLQSGTHTSLFAVWGSSANDVYAVGDQGTILHSGDRGQSWQAQPSGVQKWLSGVWGSGPNDVYVVGEDGTILHHGLNQGS